MTNDSYDKFDHSIHLICIDTIQDQRKGKSYMFHRTATPGKVKNVKQELLEYRIWNALPTKITQLNSLPLFKASF